MTTRELSSPEWIPFFNAFSRHYRGRPVTIELSDAISPSGFRPLARKRPLEGIVAEAAGNQVQSIEILLGDSGEFTAHVVNSPIRIRVGQVSNGEDEVLVIDSATDPSVRIDFRPPGAQDVDLGSPATSVDHPVVL